MDYYLSIDIGASSGRHMIFWLQNSRICMKEIYRFENAQKEKDGHLCWDLERLFSEILNGLIRCREEGCQPKMLGIDTWGVDYVLLDKNDAVLGKTYGYRDSRTTGMDDEVYRQIPEKMLYERTGIQKQLFNSIYQLMATKLQEPEIMEQAETFLMIPDYFNFLLTGEKGTEYTNATTTQLVSPFHHQWDDELIHLFGFKRSIFTEISMPGTVIGPVTKEIADRIGYSPLVVRTASHDTASAVAAVPAPDKSFVYISSGTWSLLGVELKRADCSERSRLANMTNEGGIEHRFRYLRNIMGLWMIQSLQKECDDHPSFAALCDAAKKSSSYRVRVNVNDQRFFAPKSMKQAILDYCAEYQLPAPSTTGEFAALIYGSLADAYRDALLEIEKITGYHYDSIHVVGGGANADYLNQLTAEATGRDVFAGPSEATAIGNLLGQLIADKQIVSLNAARRCVLHSFGVKSYKY